ncbi:hypothetical protein KSE_04710 [Kitasatospora setae KM-6054]|uniref:PLL-like beta propeller domain-containing protein n=1 Tax=Kitasatospora setae (strain ATCC 33774 / DSM 43861 / JCM 3304 / KCC A-0304 / NBRC 14216 / KM-6054) TaxID=452652 RepID=E4N537_KITSK|nr:hypothetical protein KSE_04710 [Kitasatospora setae KM-6054]
MLRIKRTAAVTMAFLSVALGGAVAGATTAQAAVPAKFPRVHCSTTKIEVRSLDVAGGPVKCGGALGDPLYCTINGVDHVFAVGTDNAMWARWISPSGVPSDWVSFGGSLTSEIRLYADGSGSLDFSARWSDGHLYEITRNDNGSWINWRRVD